MGWFQLLALLIVLAALFSYLNLRFVRLPTTIGVMLIALAASLALLALSKLGLLDVHRRVAHVVEGIDFDALLLHGMLAFLLFAGALHVDLSDLARHWGEISLLAIVGTLVSTFLVGGAMYLALRWLGFELPMIGCLLFGALISPTDPIAVLGIMKNVGAPRSLQTQLSGESLFNDGIGVVIFIVLVQISRGSTGVTFAGISWLLIQEAVGGFAFGLLGGILAYLPLKRVDNYQVEVLITLALAMGVYALADALHVSAPIAVVVSGLLIGNQGRAFAMSPKTQEHLDTFWELIDEIFNVVLFLLIGLEVTVMQFTGRYFWAALLAIGVTMLARLASVAGVMGLLRAARRPAARGTITVLSWGGLRGGISVAMALALPANPYRELIVVITYVVVIFSIFVQGLTIGPVIRRVTR
jgi:CPA1 family monovalent cation:H+ antiporter